MNLERQLVGQDEPPYVGPRERIRSGGARSDVELEGDLHHLIPCASYESVLGQLEFHPGCCQERWANGVAWGGRGGVKA